jgi:hypothetical protein
METESEDEHIENTEVISPSVTPVQVNTLPVDEETGVPGENHRLVTSQ